MSNNKRLTVNEAVLDQKLRYTGYQLTNGFLAFFNAMRDTAGLEPDDLLIYCTVIAASIQRRLRDREEHDVHTGELAISETNFRPISRRAVAEATGLSRELVRRKINRMIEDGLLVEDSRGVKTVNVVSKAGAASNVRHLTGILAGLANTLLAEGILE